MSAGPNLFREGLFQGKQSCEVSFALGVRTMASMHASVNLALTLAFHPCP